MEIKPIMFQKKYQVIEYMQLRIKEQMKLIVCSKSDLDNNLRVYQQYMREKQLFERVYLLVSMIPATRNIETIEPFLSLIKFELEEEGYERRWNQFSVSLNELLKTEKVSVVNIENVFRKFLMSLLADLMIFTSK